MGSRPTAGYQPPNTTARSASKSWPPERYRAVENLILAIYDAANLRLPPLDELGAKVQAWLAVLEPVPSEHLEAAYQRATAEHQGQFALSAHEILTAWRLVSREIGYGWQHVYSPLELDSDTEPIAPEPEAAQCKTCVVTRYLRGQGNPIALGITCPECGKAAA